MSDSTTQEIEVIAGPWGYAGGIEEPHCPACRSDLNGGYCDNPQCRFLLSETVQAVMKSLIEEGYNQHQAAAVAAAYTLDEEAAEAVDKFKIVDMKSADWVLKKIARAQAMMAQVEASAAEEKAAIDRRKEKLLKPYTDTISFFEVAYGRQLEEWAARELEGGKKKSINTIYGTAGFKKQPDSLIFDDEDKALTIAELDCPEAIKKSLLKTPFKSYLLSREGKAIDGVAHIEDGGNEFYYKAALPLEVR